MVLRGTALAVAGLGALCACALLAAVARPGDAPGSLLKEKQKPRGKGRQKANDPGQAPEDYCVEHARDDGCTKHPTLKKWCAQQCEASRAGCLQAVLDVHCEQRTGLSHARALNGTWGCYEAVVADSVGPGCVDDAGRPLDCPIPTRDGVSVEESGLGDVVAGGGCNEEVPTAWKAEHGQDEVMRALCTDVLPWDSQTGGDTRSKRRKGRKARAEAPALAPALSCDDYETLGYCRDGAVVNQSMTGVAFHMPESNCCVCGGGNHEAAPLEEEVSCSESAIAVRLSTASYHNGSQAIDLLPTGYKLVKEFHAGPGGDAIVVAGRRTCWAAFRGSQEDEDWLIDAMSAMHVACFSGTGVQLGDCGRGFNLQWAALQEAGLWAEMRALVERGECDDGVIMTGHSLGGALASIAAAAAYSDMAAPAAPPPPPNVGTSGAVVKPLHLKSLRCYTFGEPRAFQWYAADLFNAHVPKVRWLVWGDPIPGSPPSRWGFRHYGHAFELNKPFLQPSFYKEVPQDFGASSIMARHHRLVEYQERISESCYAKFEQGHKAAGGGGRGSGGPAAHPGHHRYAASPDDGPGPRHALSEPDASARHGGELQHVAGQS